MDTDKKNLTAETQRTQNPNFLFVGRDDKQKHCFIADKSKIQTLMQLDKDSFSASLAENMPAGHEN